LNHRRTLIAFALAACLTWTASASGQAFQGDPSDLTWSAPGLELTHASRDWIEVSSLVKSDASRDPWATFQSVLGKGWLVNRDAAFGTPSWILGPGLETGVVPMDPDAAVAFSRTLVHRVAEALGIDEPAALKLMNTAATPNPGGHTILGVDFKQTLHGYDVRTLTAHRRVLFRYDLTLGKLSNLGSDWIPGLKVRLDNVLSRAAAEARAREIIPAYAPGDGRVYAFDTYVLVGVENETEAVGRLVHEVQIQTDTPVHHWTVILDARTGDRLHVSDAVRQTDVDGNVSLGSLDAGGGTPPTAAFSVKPAVSLHVSIVGGGSATTDSKGDFKITHGGTSQVTLTGRFAGDWCNVQDQTSSNYSFSQPATPGTPANVVMNGTHTSEYITAQATAYDWVTRTHFFVLKRWPGWASATRLSQLTTYVDISSTCNAYWTPVRINFYRAGGGCNNTAFSDVICHEWGHGFHYSFHGSTSPSGYSEGVADHMGLYITGQRIMGRDFKTNGGVVRDYRVGGSANNTQWPYTSSTPSHTAGQIWAGCTMDLRDYLITKHGATKGVDIAETITLAQYSRNPGDMDEAVKETFVQDDNDANLLNGTPNFAEIAAAADRHNLPRVPDPLIVQFTHTPLPTSRDVVNDYAVSSKIISTEGTITNARLVYQVNAGPLTTVSLVKGAGDVYTAAVPAQPAVSSISYYLMATDSKTNTAKEPASGFHVFAVGHETVAFSDDFETDKGWKPANDDNATAGRFERADPIKADTTGRLAQPDDDHTPGAGTHCYVTENGTGGSSQASYHDVDNGKTTIISPVLDLSKMPAGAAKISFAYWLTVYSQLDDSLRCGVSTNGGQSWQDFWTESSSATQWREVKDLVIPGTYTNNMQIRFWTADSPNNSVTDALIDDVVIQSMDDNVAALRAQTRTPGIGTTLNFTVDAIREPNAPYVFVFSPFLGPTSIPNVGVTGLGLPFFLVHTRGLDASGSDAFPIPLPNDPILKGLKIHTEAFVAGKAWIFSNLWTLDIQ
jgi:hypothetical protein